MSVKYHVNPKTGDTGICGATKEKCPFGGDSGVENHYDTAFEARAAYEAQQSSTTLKTLKKSKKEYALMGDAELEKISNTTVKTTKEFTLDKYTKNIRSHFLNKKIKIDGLEVEDIKLGSKYAHFSLENGKTVRYSFGEKVNISGMIKTEEARKAEDEIRYRASLDSKRETHNNNYKNIKDRIKEKFSKDMTIDYWDAQNLFSHQAEDIIWKQIDRRKEKKNIETHQAVREFVDEQSKGLLRRIRVGTSVSTNDFSNIVERNEDAILIGFITKNAPPEREDLNSLYHW